MEDRGILSVGKIRAHSQRAWSYHWQTGDRVAGGTLGVRPALALGGIARWAGPRACTAGRRRRCPLDLEPSAGPLERFIRAARFLPRQPALVGFGPCLARG